MNSQEFSLPVRVYMEDTDAGGIVYHANYLKYMERARTELLQSLGFEKPAMIADGLLLVVASMDIQFHAAARLNDDLLVTAEIVRTARTYIELVQKVSKDSVLLCEAAVKIACVATSTLKPARWPSVCLDRFNEKIRSL